MRNLDFHDCLWKFMINLSFFKSKLVRNCSEGRWKITMLTSSFSFPWAWPINQSQLVTYQQALGEPDERREAVSGAVGEAGSDCESKLYLLKRPDVNQLTLLTSSTLLLRILVFMLQKIQAIFFLLLEIFGSAACRLGKICHASLQRVILSRFPLQLQKAGGSFGLEMDSNNSTSFRPCRRLALFQRRSVRHIATSFT